MPDYETMYHKLFNAFTDVIEILKKVQQETEELYLASTEDEEETKE